MTKLLKIELVTAQMLGRLAGHRNWNGVLSDLADSYLTSCSRHDDQRPARMTEARVADQTLLGVMNHLLRRAGSGSTRGAKKLGGP